jgi:hypothetical protein
MLQGKGSAIAAERGASRPGAKRDRAGLRQLQGTAQFLKADAMGFSSTARSMRFHSGPLAESGGRYKLIGE